MNKEILKIALNTKNLSFLHGYTHYAKLKNTNCGDEIKIYLIVKNKKITKFKYEIESCIYAQASASLLSETAHNKSIKNFDLLFNLAKNHFLKKKSYSNNIWKKILKLMNKSNNSRKECLLLPIKATLKALKK